MQQSVCMVDCGTVGPVGRVDKEPGLLVLLVSLPLFGPLRSIKIKMKTGALCSRCPLRTAIITVLAGTKNVDGVLRMFHIVKPAYRHIPSLG